MFFGLDCTPAKCLVCAGSFASTTNADLYQQCRLAGHASKVGNKHCLVAHIYIYIYIRIYIYIIYAYVYVYVYVYEHVYEINLKFCTANGLML